METQLKLNLEEFSDKFCAYHEENPQIYEGFKKLALKAIALQNRQRFGAKALFEILRWNTAIIGNDEFKLNNNYTSFYARLFEKEFPQHVGFFEKRKSKFDL